MSILESKFEVREVKWCVVPKKETLFSEMATYVEIVDEAGGEFLVISQSGGNKGLQEIRLDVEEWEAVKKAVDYAAALCRIKNEDNN